MDEEADKAAPDVALLGAVLGQAADAHAAALVARFGSLRALLDADRKALLACPGLGPARVTRLRVLPEIARRYYLQSLPAGTTIRSPASK